MKKMIIEVKSEAEMKALGGRLGALLRGGEVIEMVGDVGAGKTTLTKGIASGMDIDEDIQSPSFTINRVYHTPHNLFLAHYDFYRLHDPGIMAEELSETIDDPKVVTIIEWAEIVTGVLPNDRLTVRIEATGECIRRVTLHAGGEVSKRLMGGLA